MKKKDYKKVEVLGVGVDNLTFDQALNRVERLIEQGRLGRPQYLVKPNVEIVTFAQKDSELKKILNLAPLAAPDGIGLLIGSRILGRRLKERVGGPELMEVILELAQKKGYSVFFLGAAQKVVEKLAEVVKKRHPKLNITGFRNGYFDDEGEVVEQIKKARPDIVFVALGYPNQEKWIARYLNELKVPLSIAEGGSFDFISGEISRAPVWVRRIGLEWLFRLTIDPRRIRRQLALLRFLWLVLTKRLF